MINNINFKSNLVCDIDGKILSYNNLDDNFIKDKRIYNLIHKESVIPFIKRFNDLLSNKITEIDEFFLFNYKINLYLKVRMVLKKVSNNISVSISSIDSDNINTKGYFFEKLNIIIRGKFLMGSIVPLIFSIIWSVQRFDDKSFIIVFFLIIGVFFFHVAANTFNDYFDWISGRDKLNLDYILFSTGGSRAIDLKLISEKEMLSLAVFSIVVVVCAGLCIYIFRGTIILYLGLFGIFVVYFYSGYPIHLASRYGMGELVHIICLGPMFVYGCTYALTGVANISELIIGLPFGLLITACLITNEYPDSKADLISKKTNLAVLLGEKYIPYAILILITLSFVVIIYGIISLYLSFYFFICLSLIPYGIFTIKSVFKLGKNRMYTWQSCIRSFNIYILFSLSLILSTLLQIIF